MPYSRGSKVAIVGAGVSGLVTAKRLQAEGLSVTLYDRRSRPGGLWNYSEDPTARFASAVYGDLQTNFPRHLMELQDYTWTDQPLIMPHYMVHQHLLGYADHLFFLNNLCFQLDTEVVDLYYTRPSRAGTGYWRLTSRSLVTGSMAFDEFAFVVIAVDVFEKLLVPYYAGLEAWKRVWPDSVSHAKSFRNPEAYRNKNVLVVGYQASGFDITNKIAKYAGRLVVSSTRNIADQVPYGVVATGPISQLDTMNRTVVFDGGQYFDGIDHIIFCTGYEYTQPFIRASRDTDEPLFPDGQTIENLYDHVLYAPNATLAFIGMVKGAAPTFLIVQAQAAFVARVFSQGAFIVRLPPAARIRQMGYQEDDPLHALPYPKFVDYCLRLEGLCRRSGHNQDLLFRWTPELEMVFQNRREIRGAFLKHLEKQHRAVSNLGDIGIHIDSISFSSSLELLRRLVPYMILYCGNMEEISTLQMLERSVEPGVCLQLHLQIKEELDRTLPALAPSSQVVFEAGVIRLLDLWERHVSQTADVQSKRTKSQRSNRRTNTAVRRVDVEIKQQPLNGHNIIKGFENAGLTFEDELTGISQAQCQIRTTLSNYMALLRSQVRGNPGGLGRQSRAELFMSRYDTFVTNVPG